METYFRIKFYMEIIGLIIGLIGLIVMIGTNICFKNGIAEDIVEGRYKFKLKHILLVPAILMMKIIDRN